MIFSEAIKGLVQDARGTALTRLRELDFNTVDDLGTVTEIMSKLNLIESKVELCFTEVSEILDTM